MVFWGTGMEVAHVRIVLTKCGVLLLAGIPTALFGNGLRVVSQDAFAAARGEAFAATADNPSAIYYNPAGLTQLEAGHQLRVGSYSLYLDPTFQAPGGAINAGTTYHIDKPYALAPQMFYTYGFADRPVTLGVGVYAPHGAGVTWPEETGFRALAIEGTLTYLRVNPVVAVELLPGLSVAGGIMIDYGDIGLAQGTLADAAPFANHFRFEGDTVGVGFNLGIFLKADEKLTLGATLRSATPMNFEGRTSIEEQPFVQPTKVPAAAEFEFPLTAVLGVSYRPTENWNIEINADYTQWSSLGKVSIKQSEPAPFPVQQDVPFILGWEDSWILKFGATRYFPNGWQASAGYVFNENSVPNDYYSPLAADLDRHIFSVGVGRETEGFGWDVTYQLGIGDEREVKGSSPGSTPGFFVDQNADGTYDFVSHALLVSAGWRF